MIIVSLISLICIGFWGCSQELPQCGITVDASNSSNQLRLIPNTHDKTYSAILVCGSSDPVLVARFGQCLSGEEGIAAAQSLFAYCKGNNVSPPQEFVPEETAEEVPTSNPDDPGLNTSVAPQVEPEPINAETTSAPDSRGDDPVPAHADDSTQTENRRPPNPNRRRPATH